MNDRSVDPKLLAAMGVLVVAAAYFMLIRPQSARLGEARSDRAAAEVQLEVARQQAAGPPTTVPIGSPEAAELAVPDTVALPSLLRQLEGVAGESGLSYTTLTPTALAAAPGGAGGSVQVTMGASGSRIGAYTFLNRLATMPRLVVVEQITLNPDTGAAAITGKVSLQLVARIFTTAAPPAPASS